MHFPAGEASQQQKSQYAEEKEAAAQETAIVRAVEVEVTKYSKILI